MDTKPRQRRSTIIVLPVFQGVAMSRVGITVMIDEGRVFPATNNASRTDCSLPYMCCWLVLGTLRSVMLEARCDLIRASAELRLLRLATCVSGAPTGE